MRLPSEACHNSTLPIQSALVRPKCLPPTKWLTKQSSFQTLSFREVSLANLVHCQSTAPLNEKRAAKRLDLPSRISMQRFQLPCLLRRPRRRSTSSGGRSASAAPCSCTMRRASTTSEALQVCASGASLLTCADRVAGNAQALACSLAFVLARPAVVVTLALPQRSAQKLGCLKVLVCLLSRRSVASCVG